MCNSLEQHKASQASAPKLRVVARSKPAFEELDATERKQVEMAAKRFDGRKQTAADLIAGKGDEPLGPFERVRIANDKGKLAYDAWLYMSDSGTIFRSGTTKVLAEIIQDGVECDDKLLRTALANVIADKPRKSAPTPKPAPKPRAKKGSATPKRR